jgi:Holliday junction resolvase RusA-like endonuclease
MRISQGKAMYTYFNVPIGTKYSARVVKIIKATQSGHKIIIRLEINCQLQMPKEFVLFLFVCLFSCSYLYLC